MSDAFRPLLFKLHRWMFPVRLKYLGQSVLSQQDFTALSAFCVLLEAHGYSWPPFLLGHDLKKGALIGKLGRRTSLFDVSTMVTGVVQPATVPKIVFFLQS